MNIRSAASTVLCTAGLVPALLLAPFTASAQEELDEVKLLVEINATDGDAGFHGLLDGDAWTEVRMHDPGGNQILAVTASGILAEQGMTEEFFESSEPVCSRQLVEEPEERVVSLGEFLARFPAGTYELEGTSIEDEPLAGEGELTHELPAAPHILGFTGNIISWLPGDDLGNCSDPALVADGVIPDPRDVGIVGWEVTVEPSEEAFEEAGIETPFRVYTVQLPNPERPWDVRFASVPRQFLNSYRKQGVTEFKVEVGAIEESGNQTFSERIFGKSRRR